MAAHLASEAALRLVKPGNDNIEVTETVNKVAESFECKPVEGMVSHQLEQNKIDGDKTILHSLTEAQSKEHDTFAFGLHEVYGVDVLVSTGDGTEEEKKARMGVVECVKHNVIQPFHVLYEKEGVSVAQFKFTVLLMPNGPQKITGLPFDAALYKSE